MQSESRIALPYSSTFVAGKTASSKQRRNCVVSQIRAILPDLIVGWDLIATFSSGVLFAGVDGSVLADVTIVQVEAGHSNNFMILAAAFGAVLSPILVPRQRLRSFDPALVRDLVQRTVALVGLALALALALTLVFRSTQIVPVARAAGWLGVVGFLLIGGRALAAGLLRWSADYFGSERVAVLGVGTEAEWLRRAIRRVAPAGIELVERGRRAGTLDGVVADLLALGRDGTLDRVVIAQPGLSNVQIARIIYRLKALQVEVASVSPLLGTGSSRQMTDLADIPLFVVTPRPQWGLAGLVKQTIDRALALLLLLWTAPLLLLIAAAVWIDSPGPVLFRQRREGVNGTSFEIFKFRTMVWQGAGAGNGAIQTGRHDRRITRVGAFLRQSSLDEVPQLLNVLNGTMSLVGPRPHPVAMRTEQQLGNEITPDYAHRHRVRPGITGWAQIHGLRGATGTAEQLRRRVEFDNHYIENWSPWLDLRILAMTPVSLLLRRDNAF